MLYEITVMVVGDNDDEAHEAIVQMADSRGSIVQESKSTPLTIEGVTPEPINGFMVEALLTPGITPA